MNFIWFPLAFISFFCQLIVGHFGDYYYMVKVVPKRPGEEFKNTFVLMTTAVQDVLVMGTTQRLAKYDIYDMLPRQSNTCEGKQCDNGYVRTLGQSYKAFFACVKAENGSVLCNNYTGGYMNKPQHYYHSKVAEFDTWTNFFQATTERTLLYAGKPNTVNGKFEFGSLLFKSSQRVHHRQIQNSPGSSPNSRAQIDTKIHMLDLVADNQVFLTIFREKISEAHTFETFQTMEFRLGRGCVNEKPENTYYTFQRAVVRCFPGNIPRDWTLNKTAFLRDQSHRIRALVVLSKNASGDQVLCPFESSHQPDDGFMPKSWIANKYFHCKKNDKDFESRPLGSSIAAEMNCRNVKLLPKDKEASRNCNVREPVQPDPLRGENAYELNSKPIVKLFGYYFENGTGKAQPLIFALTEDGILDVYTNTSASLDNKKQTLCLIHAFVLLEEYMQDERHPTHKLRNQDVIFAEAKFMGKPSRLVIVIALKDVTSHPSDQNPTTRIYVIDDEAFCVPYKISAKIPYSCQFSRNPLCGHLRDKCYPYHDRNEWKSYPNIIPCNGTYDGTSLERIWTPWSEEFTCKNEAGLPMCLSVDCADGKASCLCQSRICIKSDGCGGDTQFHTVEKRIIKCLPKLVGRIDKNLPRRPVDDPQDTYQVIAFTFLGSFSVMMLVCFIFVVIGPGKQHIRNYATRLRKRGRGKSSAASGAVSSVANSATSSVGSQMSSSVVSSSRASSAPSASRKRK